ncbi:citrate synthase family protein [Marinobacter similis]|uniref:Uncharacterized protein n=1 Tax=Marinobacter similis TaxID=1420916 RepID=W5YKE3_9GAMM|nr:hypothetical protein [Marinobacter similis]AHI29530.1 hypothetical protein AU14_15955 [Marinobacter similis]
MSHKRLLETEKHWLTRKGKAYLSDRVIVHGKDLHQELGDFDWIHLYLYVILGRDPGVNVAKLLNSFWVSTSYPDASIWPNHVAALGGTVRSTASLSLMAGMSISEASIYGRRPEVRALDFFYRAGAHCDAGGDLFEFIEEQRAAGRTLYGYGRPLASTDERIPYTLAKAREFELDGGRYLKMALDVHAYLHEKYGYSMNVAAVHASLAADIGLNCQDYQTFATPAFVTGIAPCYQDARDQPEGSFFPVRCTNIVYNGPAKRKWSA